VGFRAHVEIASRIVSYRNQNLQVKKIDDQLRFDRIMAMSLWPRFGPPCMLCCHRWKNKDMHGVARVTKSNLPIDNEGRLSLPIYYGYLRDSLFYKCWINC